MLLVCERFKVIDVKNGGAFSIHASAIVYSVVETAKENGLNPFDYLTYLFETLLNIDTEDTDILDQLLSWSSTLPETCHVIKNT